MAEYSANATQVVNPGETVVFTDSPEPCNRGFVRHRDGTGNFLLSGWTPRKSCGCKSKSANYLVDFGANISVPTGGTVEAISLEELILLGWLLYSFLERNMSNYLIHYNHNHDALGRFARSAGSAVGGVVVSKGKKNTTRKYESAQRISKKKKAGNNVEPAKKQKGSKSNNTKLSDADRQRLVEHGSAKEITKNKDKLSNRELEAAITRLQREQTNRADLERKLSDITNPSKKEAKSLVDKMSDAGVKMNKVATTVEQGTKLYNSIAKIHNASSKEKWPVVGENNDKNNILKMQKVVMTGSAYDVWKNRSNMTPAQYENAIKRMKNDTTLQEMMRTNSSKQSSSRPNTKNTSSTSDSTYKSFYNEPLKPNVESWKDVRTQTAPRAQAKSTNKANEILKDYPRYDSGSSQKMTDEELRKKYKYGR